MDMWEKPWQQPIALLLNSAYNNGRLTVIDRRNRVCDRRKASLNGYHDRQYQDVTTTFTYVNTFTTFSKTIFAIV